MTILPERYKDLGFGLEKNDSNDFTILESTNSIKQSIHNLLQTRIGFSTKFEKPELGSAITNLLSQKPTRFVALQIKDQIELSLENYEPRIIVNDILINFNQNEYLFTATIYYTIISLSQTDTLTLDLKLIT